MYYNGYSPSERSRRNRALQKLVKAGKLTRPDGPCQICGDSTSKMDRHSEDCSSPYKFHEYVLCQVCHRQKLHRRFQNPNVWLTYCAHVKRGGYGRDTKRPEIKSELKDYQAALARGEIPIPLAKLNNRSVRRDGWWVKLTCDRAVLARFDSRVRAVDDIRRALEFSVPSLDAKQLDMIRAHYDSPDQIATMAELSSKMTLSSAAVAVSVYTNAARVICDNSEYDPPKLTNGTTDWLSIIAHEVGEGSTRSRKFKLNQSATDAISNGALNV